ncbi:MAG: hypothetical protein V1856_02670 [Candidatus Liptonbacteria bacterium]
MANQQLLDYVKQQLQLNVPREEIKTALLNTGWPEADINIVFAEVSTMGQVQPPTVAQPTQGAAQPTIKDITASVQSAVTSTMEPKAGLTMRKATIASDAFQPQNEPVFQPPKESFFDPNAKEKVAAPSKPTHGNLTIIISLGAACLVFAVLFVWMYVRSAGLQKQLDAATSSPPPVPGASTGDASASASAAEIEALRKEMDGYKSELGKITDESNLLATELSFLVAPDPKAPTSTTLNQPVTISGEISVKKSIYYLTTEDRIEISVANSSNPDVVGALKPLLGKTVELSGTYNRGVPSLTLQKVNGMTLAEIITAGKTATTSIAPTSTPPPILPTPTPTTTSPSSAPTTTIPAP